MDAKIKQGRTRLIVIEEDQTKMYEMMMKIDADNAIEVAPTILKIYTGIDFGSIDIGQAKITAQQAIEIEFNYSGTWNSATTIIEAAAERVLLDHKIRSNGRKIISKFDGKDVVTGQKFSTGAEIIWDRNFGTIIA